MLRVELPGMEREDGRMPPLGDTASSNAASRAGRRSRKPQLPPAGTRRPKRRPVRGGSSTRLPLSSAMRCGPRRFPARPSGRHGGHRSVRDEAFAGENPESRILRRADGPLGGPEQVGAHAARLLEPIAAPRQILAKLHRRELVGPPVQVAVEGDLVPAPRRLAHEVRMALGDPSQNEDRGAVPAARERLQQPGERPLEAGRKRGPAPRIGVVVVAADVEPVLRVDRQDARRAPESAQRSDDGGGHGAPIVARSHLGPRNTPWDVLRPFTHRPRRAAFNPSRRPCSTPPPRK